MPPRSQPPHGDPPLPDAAWRGRLRRGVLAWFRRHARDLPWRRTRDPYHVWLSEVMLQQTRVETVRGHFERFLARFPTIADLAAADEAEALRRWEGLGYYRRARQLHAAARRIVAEHGGRFPRQAEDVRRLPGIGRYTAGAILSIAFDAREPILEANTLRLFSRLVAYRGDPASTAGQRLLWAVAEAVLPARHAGAFNQGLMELGSQVCTARQPRCEECPLAALCRARAEGLEDRIPPPKRKPPVEERHEVAVLVRRRSRVLLVRRPDGGRWAGLWDFPRFAVAAKDPAELRAEVTEHVVRATGVRVEVGEHLKRIRHGVTRFRITLDAYEAACVSGEGASRGAIEARWVRPAELDAYPLSTTGRQLARLVAVAACS